VTSPDIRHPSIWCGGDSRPCSRIRRL
jgi:hypothetical protein